MLFNEKEYLLRLLKEHIHHTTTIWKTGVVTPSVHSKAIDVFWDMCIEDGLLVFNKIKFPDIRGFFGWLSFSAIYADAILVHHLLNDNYSVENCNMLESLDCEGPYFVNDFIVKPGEVVIDAGAYVGDFSAAAAVLGAKVYAFEPSPMCTPVAREVGRLNNFEVIEEGLGATINYKAKLALVNPSTDEIDLNGTIAKPGMSVPCVINTVDNFTMHRDLQVDFIKSDVEGFERHLLKGATRVLKTDAPDLSFRIYHNDYEDKKVLPEIISKINSDYKFRFNGHTMFASTDSEKLK